MLIVTTDVTDEQAVEQLAARTADRFGRIDVWINNAGVMSTGTFEQTPPDVFRQIVDTNFFGAVNGTRSALIRFREQDAGILINVGSQFATLTAPFMSPYIASKHALLGFTETVRLELQDAPRIHITTVLPTAVATSIHKHAANFVGRELRQPWVATSPAHVADVVISLIDRPRPRAVVGQLTRVASTVIPTDGYQIASMVHAVTPWLYDAVVSRVMKPLAFRDEPASSDAGNVLSTEDRDKSEPASESASDHVSSTGG